VAGRERLDEAWEGRAEMLSGMMVAPFYKNDTDRI
jgi:hypothetical protein